MWKKEKKAFKEGKRIQYKNRIGEWESTLRPSFTEYRIHPDDIEPITEWHDNLKVWCKTLKQMKKVIKLQQEYKCELKYWDIYKKNTCISNDGFYAKKEWYKEHGFEVITAKEFLMRYKPKKKEIGKEPLNEGEWAAFWDRYDNFYAVSKYKRFVVTHEIFHDSTNTTWEFSLPISLGHEAILKAMEETNNA